MDSLNRMPTPQAYTEVENETIPGLRAQMNPLIKLIWSYCHTSQILLGHTDEGEDSEAGVPRCCYPGHEQGWQLHNHRGIPSLQHSTQ